VIRFADGLRDRRHSADVVSLSALRRTPDAPGVTPPPENEVAELYEQHFDFVWRSLRRLGVRASQLEDAVQDVFVVVQRRLPEFERRSSVKTWLFGIALRVARDHRRRVSRLAVEVATDPEALVGTHPDPRQAAIETEAARLVQSLLDGLSEERRVVFVMSELEGFTAAEVGEALNLGINSVYSRLRLARRDFAQALRAARARADWKQR
jgi:RNA polymerase sigma-70 factor (ECF subfamily)